MKTKSKIRKNTTNKNKTLKNQLKYKSCDDFCKNVYVYEIDKQNRKIAETSNIIYNPKLYSDFRMTTCKNNFCNKDCKKTYKYYDTSSEKLFKKNMKNNFITNIKPSLIKTMKKKGAISYCDGLVYNPLNK